MSVRPRSLRVREEEAAGGRPLSGARTSGAEISTFGSAATAGTALRLRVLTLGSDTLIVCPTPRPAAGA